MNITYIIKANRQTIYIYSLDEAVKIYDSLNALKYKGEAFTKYKVDGEIKIIGGLWDSKDINPKLQILSYRYPKSGDVRKYSEAKKFAERYEFNEDDCLTLYADKNGFVKMKKGLHEFIYENEE